jgi:hypothetical protein
MRLPVGIQDFTKLRENNYVYVDKTMYLNDLVKGGSYFLSRPRRFGKSLLLSTLKAAFTGRKDLFTGLWLENNFHFTVLPVIRLDFSNINFTNKSLDEGIVDWLRINALEYDYDLKSSNARDAFRELIQELSKLGKVVVLIDEYDKPITDCLFELEKRDTHQKILKNVYGVLKPMDAYLHLVFITGVSKIGKLSLFSDLNNLQDISLHPKFALLCGYSRIEIETNFATELKTVADFHGVALPDFWDLIQFWYNGYSWDAQQKVYCPFSFLLFLEQQRFKSYWFETGTPTFLMQMIRNAKLNPLEFEHLEVSDSVIVATEIERLDPVSLMFQTGYLTIKNIENNPRGTLYALGYPNEEVRQAFSSRLLLEYSALLPFQVDQFGLELQRAILRLDWTSFFEAVNRLLAGIPYEIFPRQEIYFNSLLHLMLVNTGLRTQSQIQTSLGRMDTLLETDTHFIIFELKIGGQAETALLQMINTKYAQGLVGKPVLGIGVIFDLERKSIVAWKDQLITDA